MAAIMNLSRWGSEAERSERQASEDSEAAREVVSEAFRKSGGPTPELKTHLWRVFTLQKKRSWRRREKLNHSVRLVIPFSDMPERGGLSAASITFQSLKARVVAAHLGGRADAVGFFAMNVQAEPEYEFTKADPIY